MSDGNRGLSPVVLIGGANSDGLWGGGGIDILIGGANNDVLAGEAGSDYLLGGIGYDTDGSNERRLAA